MADNIVGLLPANQDLKNWAIPENIENFRSCRCGTAK
jgi:hypothetical protein